MPRGYCELGKDGVVEGEEEETSNNNNKRINNTININTYINNNTNAPGLLWALQGWGGGGEGEH